MQVGDLDFSSGSNTSLTSNRTINLLTTDSTAEKQAKIDAVPRVASGDYYVLFQFADGTHSETGQLNFNGFPYTIYIYGNAADNSSSSTKTVTISSPGRVISCVSCADVTVRYIRANYTSPSEGFYFSACTRAYVQWCAAAGTSGGASGGGIGIYVNGGYGYVRDNQISLGSYGIYAATGLICSRVNTDFGTAPGYGLRVFDGGIVAKNSTQPGGTVASETGSGGTGSVIR